MGEERAESSFSLSPPPLLLLLLKIINLIWSMFRIPYFKTKKVVITMSQGPLGCIMFREM